MALIPSTHRDLLEDETKAFLYLATAMPDGSPQVTPVWFDVEGEYIRINTAVGRVKDRNMQARPTVAMCIADPKDPYRYLQIRGRVVERTTEGALEHIHHLSHIYTGKDWQMPTGQQRVMYKIALLSVDAH